MSDIPLIDISVLNNKMDSGYCPVGQQLIDDIGRAFHEIGFIAIQGHGIPEATIGALREQTVKLFDRPFRERMALCVTPRNYRGYIPLGFFTPNAAAESAAKAADQYEAYKLHFEIDQNDPICSECTLYGPNKWPKQAMELKKAVLNYWQECDRVCQILLNAVAKILGLEPAYFRGVFEKPLTNMTLLHYPPRKSDMPNYGIHPHKDTDVLTILAPDPVGGLMVRPRNSQQWISADAPADALIVNVGDMLEIWSGGYFVSTPHKVINPPEQERYSFPYFAVPGFDTRVEPLNQALVSKDFDRTPMHVGEVSSKIWQSNWPDAEPVEECYDPYSH